jgi:hypothetical protein
LPPAVLATLGARLQKFGHLGGLPESPGGTSVPHHGGCSAVSRLADTLAQIDEKRERGPGEGTIPRLGEHTAPRRAWRIVGTLVIVESMGVLSLGVWPRPHVPAGLAMAPAPIAAATPVTGPAMSHDRAARLAEIEARRTAE